MASKTSPTWIAFLVTAFGIVGMIGLFATVAAPLPLERALLRDAALDDALKAAATQNPTEALAALQDRLGDSADAIAQGPGDLPTRIQAERAHMRAQFTAEAEATASRLRLLIIVVTLTAAGFGVLILAGLR
jgi:hypothetical protein